MIFVIYLSTSESGLPELEVNFSSLEPVHRRCVCLHGLNGILSKVFGLCLKAIVIPYMDPLALQGIMMKINETRLLPYIRLS
ncbi:hypothetical protein PBPRA3413 [Photobacterium profundum SS9]|uniref:Uncharacterized protein n=1 Tax=Photobacterium profundum (strain SS9) TaxID=298386 RepID=Q6LLY1_PHOPR|nr:hypothetical protein PBPRA3413 [Photobacterium profundum SS9]